MCVEDLLRDCNRGVDLAGWIAERDHRRIGGRADRPENNVKVTLGFFGVNPKLPGTLHILGTSEIVFGDLQIRRGICRVRFRLLER